MLLRNESRIKHSIMIKLVFDDNLTRELEIQETDYIQVSYRKNGCIKSGVGVIKEIIPYILKNCKCGDKETAVIILDMSTDLECHIDKFSLHDIIDVRKLVPIDCGCCCCDKVEPELPDKPSIPIPPDGCPITCKGVKLHE